MNGTDKQVKYANDIKTAMIETVEELKSAITEIPEKAQEKNLEKLNAVEVEINQYTEAGNFINEHKEFLNLTEIERLYYIKRFNDANISAKLLKVVEERIHDRQEA